jgi:hypothetical protein
MSEPQSSGVTRPWRILALVSKFAIAFASKGWVYVLLWPSLHSIEILVLFAETSFVNEADLIDKSFGIANVSCNLCFVVSCMQLLH